MPQAQPELKKVLRAPLQLLSMRSNPLKVPSLTFPQYLDKRLFIQLNGTRKIIGVLRGYDVGSRRP